MGLRLFQLSIKGSSLPRSDRDSNDPIASKSWSQIEFRDMKPNALSKQEFKMISDSYVVLNVKLVEIIFIIFGQEKLHCAILMKIFKKNENFLK